MYMRLKASLQKDVSRLSYRVLVLVCLVGLLTGCGFQLRGDLELPEQMQVVYLRGIDRYSEQGQAIVIDLTAAGSTVTEFPADATAVLGITYQNMERRVLSVDAEGKANEYELVYTLRFLLEDKKGQVLIGEQQILQVRYFIFDAAGVLGKSEEEAQLKRQMQKDAAARMLQRIVAGLRTTASATSRAAGAFITRQS
jgi:LPS-assembly lipoprotein